MSEGRGEREQAEEEKGKRNGVSKMREGAGEDGRERSRDRSEELELKKKGLYQ